MYKELLVEAFRFAVQFEPIEYSELPTVAEAEYVVEVFSRTTWRFSDLDAPRQRTNK